MRVIINNPVYVMVGNNLAIEYDLKSMYTPEQLISMISDLLLTKSILAEKIEIIK